MTSSNEIKQKNLILMVLSIEGGLFLVSLAWAYLAKINPFANINFNFMDIIIGLIGGIVLLIINYLAVNELSKIIPFFRSLKDAYNEVAAVAANVSIPGAIIISFVSGFSEEFFFRGVLQQQFGIVVASLIFGLFHIGNAKTISYGIYAILIGVFLGWLFIITGNLLVPIVVHIVNNFLALPYMRYYYNKYIKKNQTS